MTSHSSRQDPNECDALFQEVAICGSLMLCVCMKIMGLMSRGKELGKCCPHPFPGMITKELLAVIVFSVMGCGLVFTDP